MLAEVHFSQLRLFRDIAQTRSLSRAAQMHGVTPSAASQFLSELERTLDVTLIDRTTRPLALTQEGKLYADLCRDVLRRNDEFLAEMDKLRSAVEGTVRLAAIYSVGLYEMSELEAEFAQLYPDSSIEVTYLRPEKVYEAVISDRVDLGIVSYPEPNRDLSILPWRNEEMVLTALPAHPLMLKDPLDPADLNGVDFITFDDDLPIGREIAKYLKQHGVTVNNTMHFDNLQTIKEALLLGSGVSIVPERILRAELAYGRLAAVRLAPPGLSRPVGIVHRKKKRFTRAAQALLDLLVKPEQARAETPAATPVGSQA